MKPLGYYEFLSPEWNTAQTLQVRRLRGTVYFLLFWDGQLEAEGDIVGGESHISFYKG